MAACRSLSSLFEKPMPDAPTLLDSLSPWNPIISKKPVENGCFTEIFGELHFQEKSSSKAIPSPHSDHLCPRSPGGGKSSLDALLGFSSDVFPLKCSDKLQLCTESLGSESSDDVDDLIQEDGFAEGEYCGGEGGQWREKLVAERKEEMVNGGYLSNCSDVRPRTGRFPPPISSIGRSGKPWFYFKSYREGGRFVLREIRIPTHEFLHASREDGRLKLQLVLPGEDIPEGNEEEDEEEEVEEEEREVINEDNGD